MNNYIECKKLSFAYKDDIDIIKDMNFSVIENDSVGLIGANGAGKSTLLKLLIGLEEEYRGEILINKIPVIKNNYTKIRQLLGYIFQDSDNQLFMTNVEKELSFGPYNYGVSEKEIQNRVSKVLKDMNIEYLKAKQIFKLSGGEKRLIAIASVLTMQPNVLLLDEPSNTLDPKYRRRVINILNNLNCTKIIASHDLDLILDTCKKIILISEGKIIKIGDTNEILTDKGLLDNYGLELPLSLYNKY